MQVSVIIPTFRRPIGVVANTLKSLLSSGGARDRILRVIVIDQNPEPLPLGEAFEGETVFQIAGDAPVRETDARIIHILGLSPSVTRAKNAGANWVKGEVILFFDDDVTVQAGCVSSYLGVFQNNPDVGYLGGREILDRMVGKVGLFKRTLRGLAQLSPEPEYQVDGVYVGRIKPNSFMIKNFDVETDRLVRIDGARGCNWACRTEAFFKAGGFDEAYQGTALREETDLYLRLNAIGAKGFYIAASSVIHHRQAGGCENLSSSLRSLRSKFQNEVYFQRKHFASVSRVYFAIRMLPLVIETFKESRGASVLIWLKAVIAL